MFFLLTLILIRCKIKLEMETYELMHHSLPPKNILWYHTYNLTKNPHNLTELKICLMKSFIQDKSSTPIYYLAKYTLFRFPLIKDPENNMNLTFCNDYILKSERDKKKYQKMISENPLDEYGTNISLSFLYFMDAHKYGHKEAPGYLYFLVKQNLIYENFVDKIDIILPTSNYLLNLLTVGSNRGGHLPKLLLMAESMICHKHQNLSYSTNITSNLKPPFKEFLQGPYLSGNCHKCMDVLNIAMVLGSEALIYLQKRGGEQSNIPSFEEIKVSDTPEGKSHVKQSDLYSDEFYIIENLAHSGNVQAQHALGEIFFFGNTNFNAPRDLPRAREYFSQAANNSFSRSYHNLGLMAANGIGTEVNGTIAKQNFEKAVELGFQESHSGLAYLYLNGVGVDKNVTKAIDHFENASKAGNIEALSNLGALYLEELKNEKTAAIYFKKAAKTKQLSALYNLGVLYLKGIKLNITCEEILENILEISRRVDKFKLREKAVESYKRGNLQKSMILTSLGVLTGSLYHYNNLDFLLKEKKVNFCKSDDLSVCRMIYLYKSFLLYKDESKAGLKLADLFYFGSENIPVNYNLSFKIYEKMTKYFPEAIYSLSFMYEYGNGVEKNLNKSKRIIEKLQESAWKGEIAFEHFWPALLTNIKLEAKLLWNKWNNFLFM